MHIKQLYNYKILSEIPLPHLLDHTNENFAKQVEVKLGETPDNIETDLIEEKWLQTNGNQFLVKVKDIGNFHVSRENEITKVTIKNYQENTTKGVAAFLLGTVFGGILHLNSEFCLHAGTVNLDNNSVLISGDSGAGKSSLLTELIKSGGKIVTDDVAVINYKNNFYTVNSGHPNLRLWTDVANRHGFECSEENRISPNHDKFWIPVQKNYCRDNKKITTFYILKNERTEEVEFKKLKGSEKIKELMNNSFHKEFMPLLKNDSNTFLSAINFSKSIEVITVTRPEGYYADQIADQICKIEQKN